MAVISNVHDMIDVMNHARQTRQYKPDSVAPEIVDQLLDVARWTGSARNTQPWRFIVVDDKEILHRLSRLRAPINWVAAAPLGIAIVLDGESETTETYDEGRVSERLLIAATLLGLGGGTAWYGDDAQESEAKRILGVPEKMTARSIVAIGHPITHKDPRPNPAQSGRKPLSEIVRRNRYE